MQYSRRNFWLLVGLGMALMLSAHLLPRAIHAQGPWSFPAIGFGGLMLLGVGLLGISYGAMDDIQKQNMKSDWYWGSTLGLCVLCGLVLPYVLFGGGAETLIGYTHLRDTPKGFFLCGVMVTLGLFSLGYMLSYLFRRLRWMKS